MANHGMRAPRGRSRYMDMGDVSSRASEHLEKLSDPNFDAKMQFDHGDAADQLEQIGAPPHIIDYHRTMAEVPTPGPDDSAILSDKGDQAKQLRNE